MLQALGALTAFGLPLRAWSDAQATQRKTLVVLFLRGGVDGLSMVAPTGDPAYAPLRPTLHIDGALPLDSTFGLHPALAALQPLYASKRLAVLHAVGQASASRSHFDAQDFLESGLAGQRGRDGWLNRALADLPPQKDGTFRAVAVQNGVPLSLQGPQSVLAFPALKDFKVGAGAAASFEQLYAQAVDEALRARAGEAFSGLEVVKGIARAPPQNGAAYPGSALGRRLADIARLVHADVGVEIAVTEAGGFDTHLGQGAAQGQLAQKLKDVGDALVAFAADLGPRLDDVCLVTLTEFGRTARENGTRGTDHGTASAMLALGGGVRGGRVISDWPGLQPAQLHEGRDLKVTLDVRSVLAEVLSGHLGVSSAKALPGVPPSRLLL